MATCDACGARLPADTNLWRTDGDGFKGCLPCFPVSNLEKDSDKFMEGPCPGRRLGMLNGPINSTARHPNQERDNG